MTEHLDPGDPLSRLVATAEEQLRWVRAAALPGVRETVEQALAKTQLRMAFELCDGEHTNSEIAKALKTSEASVSRWTRRWRDLGIAYEVSTPSGRRIMHLISLEALGLPVELAGPDRPAN